MWGHIMLTGWQASVRVVLCGIYAKAVFGLWSISETIQSSLKTILTEYLCFIIIIMKLNTMSTHICQSDH